MKNFNRFHLFSSNRIKPYLRDEYIRAIAKKKLEDSDRMEDEHIEPLKGIHIFEGLDRDQRPGAISKCRLRKIAKQESQRKSKKLSLLDKWNLVKQDLAVQFAKQGNQPFINEVRRVESSRKRKSKITKAVKRGPSKTGSICPTNTCTAIS
jgi:hypothetical protein